MPVIGRRHRRTRQRRGCRDPVSLGESSRHHARRPRRCPRSVRIKRYPRSIVTCASSPKVGRAMGGEPGSVFARLGSAALNGLACRCLVGVIRPHLIRRFAVLDCLFLLLAPACGVRYVEATSTNYHPQGQPGSEVASSTRLKRPSMAPAPTNRSRDAEIVLASRPLFVRPPSEPESRLIKLSGWR